MTPTIRLGKLFGIEIGVNGSLVFIFALIAWTLADSLLPSDVPGQSPVLYWVAGLLGAAAFYACLLAHEISHAVVARSKGVKVSGITLWLFGGVARLEGEPTRAGDEALITAVGPLTSLVVAAIAFGLAAAAGAAAAPPLLTDVLRWLSGLNLALAIFNLVPAFPLDGGRLLSSILWWRTGSRRRGVHLAVRVGRVIAGLMIAAGVVEVFTGATLNGIWIAFIGWFLLSAGSAEESSSDARAALRSIPVSAAMSSPVVTVPDWLMVDQFLASAAGNHRFTTYPLHGVEGELTGLVRLPELIKVPPGERPRMRLREAAWPLAQVPRTTPDESLAAMVERVGPAIDRRVLVFDEGRLVGILSPSDLARILATRGPQRGEGNQNSG